MIKKPFLAVLILAGLFVLQGCIIVIQQPSAEEKELMTIQEKVVDQIASVNERINSGKYSQEEINALLTSAQQVVDESLANLESLNLPEKVRDVANQTKHYLESAKGLYAQMQKFISQFDEFKKQGMDMTTQAQEIITKQMESAQSGLNKFKKQLEQLSEDIMETKDTIEKQYQPQP
ncbi:hypothetical protein IT413_05505 [Candidatus Peregrinibacteria bacterium]|nr:hypothetical protein [Candidatus Peregrinibacteria bacterium]